jgi:hypothetical protein
VAQQLMGAHKVSAFHPFIFQKSGKSTIIRNLAVRRHSKRRSTLDSTAGVFKYDRFGEHLSKLDLQFKNV